MLYHSGQSNWCLSGRQLIIFLLPWKYELSPWGTGCVAPRTDPYLVSSGAACEGGRGHVSPILTVLKPSYNSRVAFFASAAPLPRYCPHFFNPFLLRSSTADGSPVTSLCELNPNSPAATDRENRNQKTWCWVNLNKIRGKKNPTSS